jgi:hypothetical protein
MELGASPLIYLVPLARVERAAHGLGNVTNKKTISHHFKILNYQQLKMASWFLFGFVWLF